MTNRDRADRLRGEAKEILHELQAALNHGAHNLVIRRAQEVVELVLKGLLAELGMESPKLHDVAPQFIQAVRARGLRIDPATLEWMQAVSSRLATLRAPAFNLEAEYDEQEARDAADSATRVLAFATDFISQVRPR